MFRPETTREFQDGYRSFLRAGSPKTCDRIDALMLDTCQHPFHGIGKPEPLRGDLSGLWSRRINLRDRLIHSVSGEHVTFLQCRGHYSGR